MLLCISAPARLPAAAQTLARPGWAGSGLNTDPWWKTAVLFDIRTLGGDYPDFKAITARLDAIQSLGVDAVLVPTPKLPSTTHPADAAPDTALDDFDELVHQASRRNLRVLLNFAPYDPNGEPFVLTAAARFWLSHGIAGFRLITPASVSPQDSQTMLQQLRGVANGALGQRIVLAGFDPTQAATPAPAPVNRHSSSRSPVATSGPAQLLIDSRIGRAQPDAASLRPLILQTLGQANIVLDDYSAKPVTSGSAGPPLANVMAAVLLTTHPAGLIDSALIPGLTPSAPIASAPEPAPRAGVAAVKTVTPAAHTRALPEWFRDVVALHHGQPAFRIGTLTFLDFDAQDALVWVARPPAASLMNPPIVVVCNLSAKPLQLSLADAMKSLNLRGTFLRTLLRSDNGMGAQDLNAVTLPPYAVYIGELKR